MFKFERVEKVLREAYTINGIHGLNSSYVVAINYALESNCSFEEIKAVKAVYDELHDEWESKIVSLNKELEKYITTRMNRRFYFDSCQKD